jgi:hypothetical protein
MSREGKKDPCEAGATILEIVVALALLAVAILTAWTATHAAARRLAYGKELEIAKLAVRGARETLAAVKFRASAANDDSEWLFRGGYVVARAADGSAFLMPDVRTTPLATANGLGGWVVVEFPAPPLQPLAGRREPGRIELHVDERAQPLALPEARFPFEPTPGLARLDCDGDGSLLTADLRTKHALTTAPARLIPARVAVEWRSALGMEGRYEEWFLLSFQGLR